MDNDDKAKEPTERSKSKKVLLVLLILLLMALAGGGAWWWCDKDGKKTAQKQAAEISSLQKKNASLKKQLAAQKAKNAKDDSGQTACTSKAPDQAAAESIKASITSGNTAALKGYMASEVSVVIAASEGAGPKTPDQAITSITNFITTDNTSWDYDFALPASVLSSYGKGSYAKYFPSTAIVGKASNNKVIAFSFDCDGKISTVFLAADAKLLQ
jgi:cell division protein FtsB